MRPPVHVLEDFIGATIVAPSKLPKPHHLSFPQPCPPEERQEGKNRRTCLHTVSNLPPPNVFLPPPSMQASQREWHGGAYIGSGPFKICELLTAVGRASSPRCRVYCVCSACVAVVAADPCSCAADAPAGAWGRGQGRRARAPAREPHRVQGFRPPGSSAPSLLPRTVMRAHAGRGSQKPARGWGLPFFHARARVWVG